MAWKGEEEEEEEGGGVGECPSSGADRQSQEVGKHYMALSLYQLPKRSRISVEMSNSAY